MSRGQFSLAFLFMTMSIGCEGTHPRCCGVLAPDVKLHLAVTAYTTGGGDSGPDPLPCD